MISYQWTSLVISVVLAGSILWLVRKNHLHAGDAAWWSMIACALAVVGMFPGMVDKLSAILGISYSPVLVLILGIAVLLLRMLNLEIKRSTDKQRMRILAQKVAILDSKLDMIAEQEREAEARSVNRLKRDN